MAFDLLNPGTWGWGTDYPTGESASLTPQATSSAIMTPIPSFDNVGQTTINSSTGISNITPFQETPHQSVIPTGTTTSGGGGGGGAVSEPPQPADINPILDEANNLYNALMNSANTIEGYIKGQQGGIEQNITNSGEQSKGVANTQYTRNKQTIGEAETSANKRKQNALGDLRQSLQESNVGANQRFGRGSNLAKALGEYSTGQFQRAYGGVTDTYETAQKSILSAKTNLENDFRDTITSINNWVTEQINASRNKMFDRLMEVQGMRDQAEGAKSSLRIQALQDLNSTINNIKTMAWQYSQQAAQTAQSTYENYAKNILSSFGTSGTAATMADNALGSNIGSLNLGPLSYGGTVANTAPVSYTGVINKKDENQLFA